MSRLPPPLRPYLDAREPENSCRCDLVHGAGHPLPGIGGPTDHATRARSRALSFALTSSRLGNAAHRPTATRTRDVLASRRSLYAPERAVSVDRTRLRPGCSRPPSQKATAKSGRWDSNPRRPGWKPGALPLSYTRQEPSTGIEPATSPIPKGYSSKLSYEGDHGKHGSRTHHADLARISSAPAGSP